MMKYCNSYFVLLCGAWLSVFGQTFDSKPRPSSTLESVDSLRTPSQNESTLPTITVPEYIILGSATIEIVPGEKLDIPTAEFNATSFAQRRNEKAIVRQQAFQHSFLERFTGYNKGFVRASGGTFSSYSIEANISDIVSNILVGGGGNYFITKGYAPYTDRSGGGINLFTSAPFTIPGVITASSFRGSLQYEREKYKFYGSSTPYHSRDVSHFSLKGSVKDPLEFPNMGIAIDVSSLSVGDSSTSRSETFFGLKGATQLEFTHDLPVFLNVQVHLASHNLSGFDCSMRSQKYTWNSLIVEGGLHFTWYRGMLGQQLTRLNPNVRLSAELIEHHRFYIAYEPQVQFNTLHTLLAICPYLSAGSSVLHQNITDAGTFGIESQWNDYLRTKAQVSVHTIKEYPILNEYANGLWTVTQYDRVTLLALHGEVVAKFSANDYFSSHMLMRTAKVHNNTHVPYIPRVEFHTRWQHRWKETIRSTMKMRYIGKRYSHGSINETQAPYAVVDLCGEYDVTSNLRFALEIRNMTNTQYSYWKNYKEQPITIVAAIQVHW